MTARRRPFNASALHWRLHTGAPQTVCWAGRHFSLPFGATKLIIIANLANLDHLAATHTKWARAQLKVCALSARFSLHRAAHSLHSTHCTLSAKSKEIRFCAKVRTNVTLLLTRSVRYSLQCAVSELCFLLSAAHSLHFAHFAQSSPQHTVCLEPTPTGAPFLTLFAHFSPTFRAHHSPLAPTSVSSSCPLLQLGPKSVQISRLAATNRPPTVCGWHEAAKSKNCSKVAQKLPKGRPLIIGPLWASRSAQMHKCDELPVLSCPSGASNRIVAPLLRLVDRRQLHVRPLACGAGASECQCLVLAGWSPSQVFDGQLSAFVQVSHFNGDSLLWPPVLRQKEGAALGRNWITFERREFGTSSSCSPLLRVGKKGQQIDSERNLAAQLPHRAACCRLLQTVAGP